MKSYLSRFRSTGSPQAENSQNAYSGQLTKLTKAPYVSFVSDPDKELEKNQPSAVTPSVSFVSDPQGVSAEFSPARAWQVDRSGFAGADGSPARRVRQAASDDGTCPGCARAATLQFRSPRQWWCAGCGLWLSEATQ